MTHLAVDSFDEGSPGNVEIHTNEGSIECRVARKLGTCTRRIARAINTAISNPPWRRNCGLKKREERLGQRG